MKSAHRYFVYLLVSDLLPVMIAGLLTVLVVSVAACTAQATQPAPCVQPAAESERIEQHDAESVTSAALEELYGSELEGKAQ